MIFSEFPLAECNGLLPAHSLRSPHRTDAVTAVLQEALAAGRSLILISGTIVAKDRADTVPAGIVAAGGEIIHFGMPVDPGNTRLQAVGGVPMVRRVANAALASRCASVAVVTCFAADEVQACPAGLEVNFTHGPEHPTGMASSLRCGVATPAADVEAVVVLLVDMPCIHGGPIDRPIDVFDPQRSKIVVPIKNGRRGNPILWPRSLFAERQTVEVDVGARDLLRRLADQIEAVVFDDDGIFADGDAPAALTELVGR